ncbi:sialidase family protein [Amycolatopsis thermoflava]|uniref:sialidase family protein n=1 Tax=Amycolatopsis thermoflava TaxID=84480 RepID=UPI003D708076
MTASLTTDGIVRSRADSAAEAFLPAPAAQNHAANLAVLPDGDLACVWFGGTQEGVPDISIWFSRLRGEAWTEPERLSHDDTRSEQNPVLAVSPDGELWLFYTAQRAGNQDTAEVRVRVHRDGAWTPPRTLFPATADGGVFVRQPPVVLPSGRWLLPVFHCVATRGRKWVGDHDTSAVMVSDDGGHTWTERPVPDSTGCVHMNVHRLGDGSLLALFRSRWADHVYRSASTDDGWTWSAPEASGLPNNNSSIQYVPLLDGRLALVYNHSSRADATGRRVSLYDEISEDGLAEQTAPEPQPGEGGAFWGAPRAPMSLALSADDGRTWRRRDLEVGDGHCMTNNSRDKLNRELSYPSIVQTADGNLHIAFTYFRQAIKYVRVSPAWVADA